MHRRARRQNEEEDMNQAAARIVAKSTGQPIPQINKNPHAVALGKLGGSKGGLARAAKLSKAEQSEIGRKAAQARWNAARLTKHG
jgi:hypothetical protein